MRAPVVALLLVCGLGMIGAGEYLREFVRKPWVINQVVYANDMRAAQVEVLQSKGVSHTREFSADRRYVRARPMEKISSSCSAEAAMPLTGYRGMKRRVDGWDAEFAADILQHIQMMHGTMPPYAGNEEDRKALGSYLASLNPPWQL